jgi:pimeloyl-ACP methyl ester carboxylesterase
MGLLGAGGLGAAPARSSGLGGMMWDFTLDYIKRLDERRRKRFEALETPLELTQLQRRVREKLAEMWGPFPEERNSLNVRHVGSIERPDIIVEKLIYESRPRHFVTANLYRPNRSSGVEGKLPAVIFPPGHGAGGKAYEPYQRFCALMARSGFAVLTWDPISQGERLQLWDKATGASTAGAGTREHGVLGNQCYLLGLNLMQYRVWDAIRAIDYLESRPEVDQHRIAMAGNSGGGMETLQLAPFEPRIQAAVCGCAVASFRHKSEAMLIADPEQILFGTLQQGIDHPELLAAFAPRPLMIASAKRDFVPIEGARETFRAVSEVYSIFGTPDRVSLVETDDKHGFNKELRQAAAGWLVRWLGNTGQAIGEESGELFTPEELQCTSKGQVANSLGGQTVLAMNKMIADKLAPPRAVPRGRPEYEIYRNSVKNKVAQILRAGHYRPEAGVDVPDRVFDVGAFARGVALVCADAGKDDPAVRRSVIDPLIASGYRVIGVDVRGWGETTPDMPGKDVSYSWDDFFAYRALESGRPLLGQRVKDFLAAARNRTENRNWLVVGVGAGALVAAHAAVLEPRISRLVTVGGLLSYRSLIDDPLTKQPLSSFLPGVIGAYDIRDLYAAIAPRPVLVLNPQDSQRAPVHRVKAWEELDWTAQAFEAAGATGKFDMQSQLTTVKMRKALMDWLKK